MTTKYTGLIPILLLFCTLLIAGCGFIAGGSDPEPVASSLGGTTKGTPPASSPALSSAGIVAKASGIYSTSTIDAVNPNQGFLGGGENIFITGGVFPAVANAISIYSVYFGGVYAPYVAMMPSFTETQLNVTAPPGVALGFVDVSLFDVAAGIYFLTMPNGYEYIPAMELLSINPTQGPLCVQTPIEVITNLPAVTANVTSVATAKSMYEVTIDGFQCTYDVTASPAIRVNPDSTVSLFMLSPVGASVGLKNAELIDKAGPEPNALKVDAYEYTGIVFDEIIPASGDLGTLTPIEIKVTLPSPAVIAPAITDLATAQSMYTVTIDGFDCTYDIAATEFIKDNGDGTTSLFMVSPVGASLGLKDAEITDVGGCQIAPKVDAYTYEISGGFGTWSDCVVQPSPIGPVKVGEVEITVTVTDPLALGFEVFIVPQGGNPANDLHRIHFTNTDISATTWTGTNAEAIETDMFGGGLYPDGHAAVYLYSTSDLIVGDDYTGLFDDGGRITPGARTGRHVTIDTLPPVMVVSASPQLAISPFVSTTNGGSYLPLNALAADHPYARAAVGQLNLTVPFPYSDFGGITNIPGDNPTGAQRFLNPASISNGNMPLNEALGLTVVVDFLDYNFYAHPTAIAKGYTPAGLDADPFNGDSTIRVPAGFDILGTTVGPVADQDKEIVLGSHNNLNLIARWELQGSSTLLPEMTGSSVSFVSGGTQTGGFMATPLIADVANYSMTATWALPTMETPSDYMRLVIKFAAADRAGVFYPRGDTTDPLNPLRKIMTSKSAQLDPLQLWWLREVRTDITHDNIPANGVTQTPFFQWEIGTKPRPVLDPADSLQPLFSYQIWESPVSGSLEDYRNGDYTLMYASGWSSNTTLSVTDMETALSVDLTENAWYLITVMSIDEAGNAESWPVDELAVTGNPLTTIPPSSTLTVTGTNNKGGNNWRRFYYANDNASVDTRLVSSEMWHDVLGVITSFGSNLIVPLPAFSTGELVSAEFTFEVLPGGPGTVVTWTLTRDGNLLDSGISDTIVLTGLGDLNHIEPYTYILTATGSDTVTGATDPTPVNIRFTVVPDDSITEYLRNHSSSDKQVIKEFTRQ